MKIHLQYLSYVLRHKWFVLIGCWKIVKESPWLWSLLWRGLIHDISKFKPGEWAPYAHHFYGDGRSLDVAWLLHIHNNPHHWQYWLLREDSGQWKYLDMPDIYILEMIADWYGAGRAITGRELISPWYNQNRLKILLSARTAKLVDTIIQNFESKTKTAAAPRKEGK